MTYLLLGPEGAYTDWHVDFAGSSVWYHIVKGKKVFMAAPDTAHNIRQFLQWSSSDDQSDFLGDRLEKCVRLELKEGDTMFLPGGWFHAVSTPEDSVVVGGNYINPLRVRQLITVRKIERRLGISPQAEFPKFDMLMYYAAGDFIKRCQQSRGVVGGKRKSAFVSKLEARGLDSLGAYLKSVVQELESTFQVSKARIPKGKLVLKSHVDRCREEIGLITSFLEMELKRLREVYDWDALDEADLGFLDEAILGNVSLSRASRRLRRTSDDSYMPEHSKGTDETNGEQDDKYNEDDVSMVLGDLKDGEGHIIGQPSSERAEESVEVILSIDDGQECPSSPAGLSVDRMGSVEVLLSSSEEEFEETKRIAEPNGCHRLNSEVDGVMLGSLGRDEATENVGGTNPHEKGDAAVTGIQKEATSRNICSDLVVGVGGNVKKGEPCGQCTKADTPEAALRTITLEMMINQGTISAGKGVLLWKYKNFKEVADLTDQGVIEITVDGVRKAFNAPTPFAMFMSKSRGSLRKKCNGWNEVFFQQRNLSDWRLVGGGNLRKVNPPAPASIVVSKQEIPLANGPSCIMNSNAARNSHKLHGLRPAVSPGTGLAKHAEKGDGQRQSRAGNVRAEALKRHSELITTPIVPRKHDPRSLKGTSKQGSPSISAEAAEMLAGVDVLTKICNQLEKEQDLLDQFNLGKLRLKDGGELLKESVQKKVEAFNEKAGTISAFLLEPNENPLLSKEVVKIRPDIVQTIGSLIKRANGGSLNSHESQDRGSKEKATRTLNDNGLDHGIGLTHGPERVRDDVQREIDVNSRSARASSREMKSRSKTHGMHERSSRGGSERSRQMIRERQPARDRQRDRDRHGDHRDRHRDYHRDRGHDHYLHRDHHRGRRRVDCDGDKNDCHRKRHDRDDHRREDRKADPNKRPRSEGLEKSDKEVRGSTIPMTNALPQRTAGREPSIDGVAPVPRTIPMVMDPRIAAMRNKAGHASLGNTHTG